MAEATLILVVDDDSATALLVKRRLEREGHRAMTATNRQEALAILAEEPVALMLLDYKLSSEVDGLAFFAELRFQGYDVPTVMLTAFSREETVIEALRAGIRDFVPKTITYLDYLPVCVARVLKQVRTERQLVESEARFRMLADSSPVFIWMTDGNGVCTFSNASWSKFLGRPPLGEKIEDAAARIHPDDAVRVREVQLAALESRRGHNLEYRQLAYDGEYRWILVTSIPRFLPDKTFVGQISSAVDITDRIHAEEMFRGLFDSAPDAFIIVNQDGNIELLNDRAAEFFGHAPEMLIGLPVESIIPEVERPRDVVHRMDQRDPKPIMVGSGREVSARRKDGAPVPVEVSLSPVITPVGAFVFCAVRDVSERRRSEERIREQAACLDQATDAIHIVDLDDRVMFWNRGAETLYGWSANEVLGLAAFPLILRPSADDPALINRLVLEKGEWRGELPQTTKGGREIIVQSQRTLLRDANGAPRGVLVINSDISGRKKLEAQLAQAQKMDAIGRLAGGVAHDFNNLLTVILGYAQLLLAETPVESSARGPLLQIEKAGLRAAGLTQQLLAFSRRQVVASVILDINAILESMQPMIQRIVGEDIDIAWELQRSLGFTRMDPSQVEQIVLNLIVNARDAMPTGGHLTISTKNVVLDSSYASQHLYVEPGRYLRLSVSDDGCGMDEATKSRVFEPFFTTKEVGKGTGLGLATVYGIVKHAGGSIEIYSEVGHGTTFKIYLPRVETDIVGMSAQPEKPEDLSGSETILLVEDEAAVRELAKATLEASGYRVVDFEDSRQAAAWIEGNHADLLVSDVVMPKMSGRQLAEAARAARPGLKILFVSGYTDDAVIHHGIIEANEHFLHKPFTPKDLLQKIRQILRKA